MLIRENGAAMKCKCASLRAFLGVTASKAPRAIVPIVPIVWVFWGCRVFRSSKPTGLTIIPVRPYGMPVSAQASSVRRFCFTDFPKEGDSAARCLEYKTKIPYEYIIVGKEICPETRRFHHQGYVELKKKTRLRTIRCMLQGWHVEMCGGSSDQNKAYCEKDGNLALEDGVRNKSGERTDIVQIRDAASKEGIRKIVPLLRSYQHLRFAEGILKYTELPRTTKPYCIWIYGPTGTGKSKLARQKCEGTDVYVKNFGKEWWDGYDKHESIILDDFREWFPFEYLLNLIDRYSFRFEVKGGYRQCTATKIVITCPNAPSSTYDKTPEESKAQLYRRLDEIWRVDAEGETRMKADGTIWRNPDAN